MTAPTNKLDEKTWVDLANGVKSPVDAAKFALECSAYEDINIKYEKPGLIVSTLFAPDTGFWETAISHRAYNEGLWIAVTQYNSQEEAKSGHEEWVKAMTADCLPAELTEIFNDKSYQQEGPR